MGRYLNALAKRGYVVTLMDGKMKLPAGMPGTLARQALAAKSDIEAELRAGDVVVAEPIPVVRESRITAPAPEPAIPNRHYADPRHDLDVCTEAWAKLYLVAVVEGVSVWFWDMDKPRPAEPYCWVQPVRVGDKYLYWPTLRDGGIDYFWTPAALESDRFQ